MVRFLRRRVRRILIDVDTQIDLVHGQNRDNSPLLRRFRRLIAWARLNAIPVISTTIANRPNDLNGDHVLCCVEGTEGQRKIRYTTLPEHIIFPADNCQDMPRHILSDHQQIIFEKRSADPFVHPRADRLLTDTKADEFIVFGTGLTTAIEFTVLGLLRRSKNVLVVTDAVAMEKGRDAIITWRKLEAKGAKLVQTETVAGTSRLIGRHHPRLPIAAAISRAH